MQVVIADAGPVIALSRIGMLTLLQQSFTKIWITETVRDELLFSGQFLGQNEIQVAIQSWMDVKEVSAAQLAQINASLDAGERSSIALCMQMAGSLLIVDDLQGRNEASALGLDFTGLVGVLLRAYRLGLLKILQPALLGLEQQNYFLSKRLVEQVLRETGEIV